MSLTPGERLRRAIDLDIADAQLVRDVARSVVGTTTRWPLKPEVRAALLEAQRGVCASCAKRKFPLVVDHSYSTGFVRAAVCESCNGKIGRAEYVTPAFVAAYIDATNTP